MILKYIKLTQILLANIFLFLKKILHQIALKGSDLNLDFHLHSFCPLSQQTTQYPRHAFAFFSSCQWPETEIKWAQNLTFLSMPMAYTITVAMAIPVSCVFHVAFESTNLR